MGYPQWVWTWLVWISFFFYRTLTFKKKQWLFHQLVERLCGCVIMAESAYYQTNEREQKFPLRSLWFSLSMYSLTNHENLITSGDLRLTWFTWMKIKCTKGTIKNLFKVILTTTYFFFSYLFLGWVIYFWIHLEYWIIIFFAIHLYQNYVNCGSVGRIKIITTHFIFQ